MANLHPDANFITELSLLLDSVNEQYVAFLSDNNNVDDPTELADIMNSMFEVYDMDHIYVDVGSATCVTAVDWYIQNAVVDGDGEITIMLDPSSINGYWGPATFKDVVLKTLEHEDIHMRQRDRMGVNKYNSIPSGYMKGVLKAAETGNQNDMKRMYFRDPQELMAHGHDIYRELQRLDNPQEALRNPESFRNDLPTYDKHRAIFPPNAKPLQRLLGYAARYFEYA